MSEEEKTVEEIGSRVNFPTEASQSKLRPSDSVISVDFNTELSAQVMDDVDDCYNRDNVNINTPNGASKSVRKFTND